MKTRLIVYSLILPAIILLMAGAAAASEVSQGKCISYDQGEKLITIEEYDINFSPEFPYGHPTGQQTVYNVAAAMIGIIPEPGDILRFAYKVEGSDKKALKVMNVSKQDLRKK